MVVYRCCSFVQIQFAVVIRYIFYKRKRECHSAHWQVTHAVGAYHEMLVRHPVGKHFVTGKDAVTYLFQVSQSRCRVVVVRSARPEGFFIQLYDFVSGSAIDHSGQMAVPDRQGFQPSPGRSAVPKLAFLSPRQTYSHCQAQKQKELSHFHSLILLLCVSSQYDVFICIMASVPVIQLCIQPVSVLRLPQPASELEAHQFQSR